uniref:Putative secreted protein n=1 Tax=Anopheles darlingi TaxID=43151 RepID=A0A2M4D162_ANODA
MSIKVRLNVCLVLLPLVLNLKYVLHDNHRHLRSSVDSVQDPRCSHRGFEQNGLTQLELPPSGTNDPTR